MQEETQENAASKINLEALIAGLKNTQCALFQGYVSPDAAEGVPVLESVAFTEGFYHLGDVITLLDDPAVQAAAQVVCVRLADGQPA